MKKTILFVLAAAVLALPASAKMPWVKKAQKEGIAQVKDCQSCHSSKTPSAKDMNEVGKWLMDQKAAKKAADVDITWLKEYYAKKK